MAYFFLKRDDEKNALTCLKSSVNLKEQDSLFSKSLFIERLVEFSMAVFADAREEDFSEENLKEERDSSHIWTP